LVNLLTLVTYSDTERALLGIRRRLIGVSGLV